MFVSINGLRVFHCHNICLNLPESMYTSLKKKVREADNIIKFGRTRSYDIQNHTKKNILYCWSCSFRTKVAFRLDTDE